MVVAQPLHDALGTLFTCGWKRFEISTEHLVAIETAADSEPLIEQALCVMQELGLATPQAHALLQANVAAADKQDRERDIQRLLHHIEISARFSVRTVVIHPGGYNPALHPDFDDILSMNVAAFRRLGDAAAAHGMRIGIENLPYPGVATASDMLDLLQAIDHPAMGVNLDTSHANMCSLNSADMVRQLGDQLISTHISDNDGSGDQHRIPGHGSIDWLGLMESLQAIGYTGDFNLEIPGERHRIPALHLLKTRYALDVAECLIALMNKDD